MTDLSTLHMIVTWGGTFIAGAFGVGVGYATIREQLRSFKEELRNYKETAAAAAAAAAILAAQELTSVKERVSRVEGKSELQVGTPRCGEMRDECQNRISSQLSELSVQVDGNREVVTEYINNLQKFVGRVERYMEENGHNK